MPICPVEPVDDNVVRIILVGDAGHASAGDPILDMAARCARPEGQAESHAVVLLGDNVYGKGKTRVSQLVMHRGPYGGVRPPSHDPDGIDRAELKAQLDAFDPAHLFVVPGNHDWYQGKKGLDRERTIIKEAEAHWLAGEEACGGAVGTKDLTHGVTLLGFDSMAVRRCSKATRDRVIAGLTAAPTGWLVLAFHHPTRTIGKHHRGGKFVRKVIEESTAESASPKRLVLVSGHDHLLADLTPPLGSPALRQIVSGAGSVEQEGNNDKVHGTTDDDHWSLNAGFVVLDLSDAEATVRLVAVGQAVTSTGHPFPGAVVDPKPKVPPVVDPKPEVPQPKPEVPPVVDPTPEVPPVVPPPVITPPPLGCAPDQSLIPSAALPGWYAGGRTVTICLPSGTPTSGSQQVWLGERSAISTYNSTAGGCPVDRVAFSFNAPEVAASALTWAKPDGAACYVAAVLPERAPLAFLEGGTYTRDYFVKAGVVDGVSFKWTGTPRTLAATFDATGTPCMEGGVTAGPRGGVSPPEMQIWSGSRPECFGAGWEPCNDPSNPGSMCHALPAQFLAP